MLDPAARGPIRLQTGGRGYATTRSLTVAMACMVTGFYFLRSGSLAGLGLGAAIVLGASLYFSTVHRVTIVQLTALTLPLSFYAALGARTLVSASDLLLPILILAAFAAQKSAGPGNRVGPPVGLFLFVILGSQSLAWLSLTVASILGNAALIGNGVFATVKLLLVLTYALGIYLHLAPAGLQGALDFCRAWAVAALVSASVGVLTVLAYIAGIDTGFTYQFRAIGTFEDPNAFATYLIISIGIAMFVSWTERGTLFSLPLVVMSVALLLTGSRAALLAVLFIVVLFSLLSGSSAAASSFRKASILVAVSIVALFAAFPQYFSDFAVERAVSGLTTGGTADDVRFTQWRIATDLWLEAPLLGHGVGQFRAAAASELGIATETLAHSTYLSLLAEIGIVGFVVLALLPGVCFYKMARLARASNAGALGVLFALTGVAIMALTLNLENNRGLWALIGLCMALALPGMRSARTFGPQSIDGIHSRGRGRDR